MTAEHVVYLILEAGEDPKKVFREFPRSTLPGPEDVEYRIEAEWEQEDPEGHFEDPQDVEFVREQIRADNVWGWCSVHVWARWEAPDGQVFTGDGYLGGCSYHSKEDFMQPGGYYDDMKSEAYDRLIAELEEAGIE